MYVANDDELPRLQHRAERADRHIRQLSHEVDRLRHLLQLAGVEAWSVHAERQAQQAGDRKRLREAGVALPVPYALGGIIPANGGPPLRLPDPHEVRAFRVPGSILDVITDPDD